MSSTSWLFLIQIILKKLLLVNKGIQNQKPPGISDIIIGNEMFYCTSSQDTSLHLTATEPWWLLQQSYGHPVMPAAAEFWPSSNDCCSRVLAIQQISGHPVMATAAESWPCFGHLVMAAATEFWPSSALFIQWWLLQKNSGSPVEFWPSSNGCSSRALAIQQWLLQ